MVNVRSLRDLARGATDIPVTAPPPTDTRAESATAVEAAAHRLRPREKSDDDDEAEGLAWARGSKEHTRTVAAQAEMTEHDILCDRSLSFVLCRVVCASSGEAARRVGEASSKSARVEVVAEAMFCAFDRSGLFCPEVSHFPR